MTGPCATCGSKVLVNRNAGDWDWPYACTWCDRERLPEHLRASNPWDRPEKIDKPNIWTKIKAKMRRSS